MSDCILLILLGALFACAIALEVYSYTVLSKRIEGLNEEKAKFLAGIIKKNR